MGKVLEKKGEALLAVRALQRAINMDPNNSTSHHLLGQAYRDLGRSEEAERELTSRATPRTRRQPPAIVACVGPASVALPSRAQRASCF